MNANTAVTMLAASVLLCACSPSGQEDLQAWMNQQRAQTRPKVEPIPEPKKFTPVTYAMEAAVEPQAEIAPARGSFHIR